MEKCIIIVDIPSPDPCEFVKVRNVSEVEQTGFVDLASALANHSVPSDIESSDETYNGIDDPASIMGKPRDVFEAAHVRETVANYTPPSKNPSGE